MSHWWSPRAFLRTEELKALQKRAAALQASNVPVPASLQEKIADLQRKLSNG